MKKIHPLNNLKHFAIEVPGSKSYANRALILAALADGKSILKNIPFCDDSLALIQALKELGISIKQKNSNLEIRGGSNTWKKPKKPLNLGNAGTAVRFLTAVLATMPFESCVTGDSRMKKRPIQDLVNALNGLGAKIHSTNSCPPVYIKGGKLRGGKIRMRANMSSQFVSGILIAAPLMEKGVTVDISTSLTSASYLETTIDILKEFGIIVQSKGNADHYTSFVIKEGQKYRPQTYEIPADASAASYFLAIAAIHGTSVSLPNMAFSFQGDFQFLKILEKMGGAYHIGNGSLTFTGPKNLKALGAIDVNTMPDAAMTAAVVAAFAKGKTTLCGLGNLKYKESDRLRALESELRKIGCEAKSSDDSLEIMGNPAKLHGAVIDSHRDHRMAMCFAVLGTKVKGISIKNPECVSKTYPEFWEDLKKVSP